MRSDAVDTEISTVHLVALLFSGVHGAVGTVMGIAGPVFLAGTGAVFPAAFWQRIIAHSLTLLNTSAASEAAGREGSPRAPAAVYHQRRVTLAGHTLPLLAPVTTVDARSAIRPGQVTGAAIRIVAVCLAPEPFAVDLNVAVS